MGLWTGNYSRLSYDEQKEYVYALTQQGIPWVDADDNEGRQALFTQIRRVQQLLGDGTQNDGFRCVGTDATNDFTINGGAGTGETAGRLFVRGLGCLLYVDTNYMNLGATQSDLSIFARITGISYNVSTNQTTITDSAANWTVNEFANSQTHFMTLCPDITNGTTYTIVGNTTNTLTVSLDATTSSAIGSHYRINLSPPHSGTRTDDVYLNVYLDEYDSTDDPNILQPLIVPKETQRRAKVIHSLYIKRNAGLGTCTTNGLNVAKSSGSDFTGMYGSIEINGVNYTIDTVKGASTLTLTTSAGVQASPVAFSTSFPDYVDVDGNQHWTMRIATINMPFTGIITALDVIDRRQTFYPYPILSLRQLYGVDLGVTTNVYEIFPSPGFTDLSQITPGVEIMFKAGAAKANTGACILYVNGFGPFPITKNGGTALAGGDISNNEVVTAVFDGTNMEISAGQPGEWLSNGNDIYYNAGNVGIGGLPSYPLHVNVAGASSDVSAAFTQSSLGVSNVVDLVLGRTVNGTSDSARLSYRNDTTVPTVSLSLTGGTPIYVTGAGLLGLGTNNPLSLLHLKTTATNTPIRLHSTGGTDSEWLVQSDGGVGGGAGFTLYSVTASMYRMYINGSGYIGFNTSSPATGLTLVGTDDTSSLITSINSGASSDYLSVGMNGGWNGGLFELSGTTRNFNFYTNGSSVFTIAANHCAGVNKSSPSLAALDIVGGIHATDSIVTTSGNISTSSGNVTASATVSGTDVYGSNSVTTLGHINTPTLNVTDPSKLYGKFLMCDNTITGHATWTTLPSAAMKIVHYGEPAPTAGFGRYILTGATPTDTYIDVSAYGSVASGVMQLSAEPSSSGDFRYFCDITSNPGHVFCGSTTGGNAYFWLEMSI